MKNILQTFFLILFCIGSYQKLYSQDLSASQKLDPVGIGLFFINKMQDLPLYNSQNSNLTFDTVKIKRITDGNKKGSFEIKIARFKDAFDPFECSPGSSVEEGEALTNSGLGPHGARLIFRVLQYSSDEYEAVISEKDKTTAIIKSPKRDLIGHFETWEHYLERVAALISMDPYAKGLSIFDFPGGKRIVPIFEIPMRIDSVKGYWARITDHRKISGWVKWRDDNKLLVEFIEYFIK